jgi:O-methyltransferase domain
MTPPPLQPHETIWTLTNAVVPSTCLHVIAELGVADHIGDGPASESELASRCGVDADALGRVLRLLCDHGVFEESDGDFRHNPASELLRSDHPMSMRGFPRMMGLPVFQTAIERLSHSVRTGSPSIETVEPNGLWAYLQDRPGESEIFGQAMTAKAVADIAAVLGAYDFGAFGTIADVGGGRGHLLRAVLDAVPSAEGVLFDLPQVIAAVDVQHERLTLRPGDFFADDLPSADAYVLMEVIHDWPDDACVTILDGIRRAARPGATVLVIENVIAEDRPDPRGRTLDVVMLAVTGGRERTATELGVLFERAGLKPGAVVPTAGPLHIVEAATP